MTLPFRAARYIQWRSPASRFFHAGKMLQAEVPDFSIVKMPA
jgi:hypothetical protein